MFVKYFVLAANELHFTTKLCYHYCIPSRPVKRTQTLLFDYQKAMNIYSAIWQKEYGAGRTWV